MLIPENIKRPIKFLSEIKNINGIPYALVEGEEESDIFCVCMDPGTSEWVFSYGISQADIKKAPQMKDDDIKKYIANNSIKTNLSPAAKKALKKRHEIRQKLDKNRKNNFYL